MHPTLTPEAYAIERAICDKANAWWDANATFSKSGWSSLPSDKAIHPDYAACDNAMRGRVEQYELLTDTPERFHAYVSSQTREQRDATNCIPAQNHPLTTWTGDLLGSVNLGRGWRVQSYIGTRMYQAYARVNGREFTGRTFGEGTCVALRETAASKRKRNA